MKSSSLAMMHLREKNKTINKKIGKMFVADSGSTSHMVNSLKNITNIKELKMVVKTGNKKRMTG